MRRELYSRNDSHVADVDNVSLAFQAVHRVLPIAVERAGMLKDTLRLVEV